MVRCCTSVILQFSGFVYLVVTITGHGRRKVEPVKVTCPCKRIYYAYYVCYTLTLTVQQGQVTFASC